MDIEYSDAYREFFVQIIWFFKNTFKMYFHNRCICSMSQNTMYYIRYFHRRIVDLSSNKQWHHDNNTKIWKHNSANSPTLWGSIIGISPLYHRNTGRLGRRHKPLTSLMFLLLLNYHRLQCDNPRLYRRSRLLESDSNTIHNISISN
jgi:hypothetical protein